MAPKKVNRQEKRLQIMEAAMKVFAEKGLTRSRIADIAEEAGIGKGTIYEYFRNRDEIFIESCNLMIKDYMSNIREIAASSIDPTDKLYSITKISFEMTYQFSPDMAALLTDIWSHSIRTNFEDRKGLLDIRPVYDEARQIYTDIINDGIKRGIFKDIPDAEAVSSAILGIIDGLQLQWMLAPDKINLVDIADKFLETLMKGLKK